MARWSKKDIVTAQATVRKIQDGRGGRNAKAQLDAARTILMDDAGVTLARASNTELLAEVAKRGLQAPTVDLDEAERAMEARRGEG